MPYRLVADAVVTLHVVFVVFVVLGGGLALRWRWIAWVHAPAALWGAIIEFMGSVCPLTPLENHFRRLAGESGYAGGFIEHYVIPALYPADYTLGLRITLGTIVVVLNGVAYSLYFRRRS